MQTQTQQIKELVDDVVVMAGSSGRGAEGRRDESDKQQTPDEKVIRAAKEPDEVAYLKIILDSLVDNQALSKTSEVDLDRQFIQELKNSVDSILKADSRIEKQIRTKVLNAFDVLIDNHDKYF